MEKTVSLWEKDFMGRVNQESFFDSSIKRMGAGCGCVGWLRSLKKDIRTVWDKSGYAGKLSDIL